MEQEVHRYRTDFRNSSSFFSVLILLVGSIIAFTAQINVIKNIRQSVNQLNTIWKQVKTTDTVIDVIYASIVIGYMSITLFQAIGKAYGIQRQKKNVKLSMFILQWIRIVTTTAQQVFGIIGGNKSESGNYGTLRHILLVQVKASIEILYSTWFLLLIVDLICITIVILKPKSKYQKWNSKNEMREFMLEIVKDFWVILGLKLSEGVVTP